MHTNSTRNVVAAACLGCVPWVFPAAPSRAEPTRIDDISPAPAALLERTAVIEPGRVIRVQVSSEVATDWYAETAGGSMEFPLPEGGTLLLTLERFSVTTPETRFLRAAPGGDEVVAPARSVLLRGSVADQPGSHAFLALSADGPSNGYIVTGVGTRYVLSTPPAARGMGILSTIHRDDHATGLPDFVDYCGTSEALARGTRSGSRGSSVSPRSAPLLGAPHLAFVAIDADQAFVGLFGGDDLAAHVYIQHVIAAVSDIYIRDFDVRLVLAFARTWPAGGEPFDATDLDGFANYWINNEDMTGLNLVHMFSGQRDTPYGGIAYLTDPCSGFAFGISSIMLGSFPMPVDGSDLGNWDVVVVAHELGHNMGTLHTHDGYTPPIDQCGSTGAFARSDIMSYCHTVPGGLYNIDMRFHRRVQDVIASSVASAGCLARDCNGNLQADAQDIAGAVSPDINADGVPDECEDCNDNGVLDNLDIAGGALDINNNGIPDTCEADCNANGLPDEYEVTNALVPDTNGNLVPDTCEPDCNNNGVADHRDIALGTADVDRDTVPDVCQDCNSNGLVDYIDMGRPLHVFVGELTDHVREYHGRSGVLVRTLGSGVMQDVYDVELGPDGRVYAASFGNDRVFQIDVATGAVAEFVAAGSGGLDGPSGLAFGPGGRLYVSSQLNSSVLEFDTDGTFLRTLVTSGSGGLTAPFDLTFSPSGHLFVTSSNNSVIRVIVAAKSFVSVFVPPGSGGLNGPRGLTFKPDGKLLVASRNTNSVLEYNPNGSFSRIFTDLPPTGPWGVRIGPNGNVFVVRGTGSIRVQEYEVITGRYLRSFVRGDFGLPSPTGLVFLGPTAADCNDNWALDSCEVTAGTATDCNANGVLDACETPDPSNLGACCPLCDTCRLTTEEECLSLGVFAVYAGDCTTCDPFQSCPTADFQPALPAPPPHDHSKNRYVSFNPNNSPCSIKLYKNGTPIGWVGAPDAQGFARAQPLNDVPYFGGWPGTVHVGGCEIVPDAEYEFGFVVPPLCESPALGAAFATVPRPLPKFWGDTVGSFAAGAWSGPNGIVNVNDFLAALQKFQGIPSAPHVTVVDVQANSGNDPCLNRAANFADAFLLIKAFQGEPYPFVVDPALCPRAPRNFMTWWRENPSALVLGTPVA